jgi:hypothetical protein
MEQFIISFDISSQKHGDNEAADLGERASKIINRALFRSSLGSLVGGTYSRNTIRILIHSENPEESIHIIKSSFANNPLSLHMRIEQDHNSDPIIRSSMKV